MMMWLQLDGSASRRAIVYVSRQLQNRWTSSQHLQLLLHLRVRLTELGWPSTGRMCMHRKTEHRFGPLSTSAHVVPIWNAIGAPTVGLCLNSESYHTNAEVPDRASESRADQVYTLRCCVLKAKHKNWQTGCKLQHVFKLFQKTLQKLVVGPLGRKTASDRSAT